MTYSLLYWVYDWECRAKVHVVMKIFSCFQWWKPKERKREGGWGGVEEGKIDLFLINLRTMSAVMGVVNCFFPLPFEMFLMLPVAVLFLFIMQPSLLILCAALVALPVSSWHCGFSLITKLNRKGVLGRHTHTHAHAHLPVILYCLCERTKLGHLTPLSFRIVSWRQHPSHYIKVYMISLSCFLYLVMM